jgi:pseudaminic acid biosynthesis-associated methylase
MKQTQQMEAWSGTFGRAYTDRNALSLEELEALYQREFGLGRRAMNQEFLAALPRDIRVLEVGSNVGNQLLLLQSMGFARLYGIELQPYAVELSKRRTHGINIIEGSAFDLPYRDGFFDLVFTSGVLIHLSPEDIGTALDEIHRCTSCYIWGMEYFSETCEEVSYRGEQGLLWKCNFPQLYLERFSDLRLVREVRYPRTDGANEDVMFLLERTR